MKPLCFVLMPFGIKSDGNKEINFDIVYRSFIRPAIIKAGLDPIRADEEKAGGFIHKPMYERLMFCHFAVADLSFANANVFYELGIRHALKPHSTVSIFDTGTKIPFDTAPLRTFPYSYDNGEVKDVQAKIDGLSDMIGINLNKVKKVKDSPIGQLIPAYKFPNLKYLQDDADAFASAALDTKKVKTALREMSEEWMQLETAKKEDGRNDEEIKILAVKQNEISDKLISIVDEQGEEPQYNYNMLYAIIDACKNVQLFDKLASMLQPLTEDGELKENIYIKQQLAFAYNKTKKRKEAIEILEPIIEQYGPNPETSGLLGAVYKGLMNDNKNDKLLSAAHHKKAVNAYVEGFESDPRDFYPGINALTLMYLGNKPDDRFSKYMPLVKYAVERALRTKSNDYWVQASALELAVLDMDEEDAISFYADAVTCSHAHWMSESTGDNLKKIYDKTLTAKSAEQLQWLKEIIIKLSSRLFD